MTGIILSHWAVYAYLAWALALIAVVLVQRRGDGLSEPANDPWAVGPSVIASKYRLPAILRATYRAEMIAERVRAGGGGRLGPPRRPTA